MKAFELFAGFVQNPATFDGFCTKNISHERFVCFVYSPRRPENPFNFLRFQKLTPPHRAYCFAIVCTGMRFFKSFKGGETVLGFVSLAAFLIE